MGFLEIEMKLFVWTGFCPDYTDGIAFAIAETIEQAQQMVIVAKGYEPFDWGALSVHPVDSPIAFAISGGG